MKLYELYQLNEDEYNRQPLTKNNDPNSENLKEIKNFIFKNCQPWIKELNGFENVLKYPFFRGFNIDINDVEPASFTKKIRPDRRPLHTSPIDTNEMNNYIYKCSDEVNIPEDKLATRNNSLFVTSNRNEANKYGALYVVIPVGEFFYTWDSEMHDWTEKWKIIKDRSCSTLVLNRGIKLAHEAQVEVMVAGGSVLAIKHHFFTALKTVKTGYGNETNRT